MAYSDTDQDIAVLLNMADSSSLNVSKIHHLVAPHENRNRSPKSFKIDNNSFSSIIPKQLQTVEFDLSGLEETIIDEWQMLPLETTLEGRTFIIEDWKRALGMWRTNIIQKAFTFWINNAILSYTSKVFRIRTVLCRFFQCYKTHIIMTSYGVEPPALEKTLTEFQLVYLKKVLGLWRDHYLEKSYLQLLETSTLFKKAKLVEHVFNRWRNVYTCSRVLNVILLRYLVICKSKAKFNIFRVMKLVRFRSKLLLNWLNIIRQTNLGRAVDLWRLRLVNKRKFDVLGAKARNIHGVSRLYICFAKWRKSAFKKDESRKINVLFNMARNRGLIRKVFRTWMVKFEHVNALRNLVLVCKRIDSSAILCKIWVSWRKYHQALHALAVWKVTRAESITAKSWKVWIRKHRITLASHLLSLKYTSAYPSLANPNQPLGKCSLVKASLARHNQKSILFKAFLKFRCRFRYVRQLKGRIPLAKLDTKYVKSAFKTWLLVKRRVVQHRSKLYKIYLHLLKSSLNIWKAKASYNSAIKKNAFSIWKVSCQYSVTRFKSSGYFFAVNISKKCFGLWRQTGLRYNSTCEKTKLHVKLKIQSEVFNEWMTRLHAKIHSRKIHRLVDIYKLCESRKKINLFKQWLYKTRKRMSLIYRESQYIVSLPGGLKHLFMKWYKFHRELRKRARQVQAQSKFVVCRFTF